MAPFNRREFAGVTLAALETAAVAASAQADTRRAASLPTVRWGDHEISRVLVGHNPIKGQSHLSAELSREMRSWFAADPGRGTRMLAQCEELGINTCQMGDPRMEELLRAHYDSGGRLQWISTFYSKPGEGKDELARILKMTPRPIGIQMLGNTSDRLMRDGQIERARDTLKMFRDAGVLVGLCSHNHEVIDYAEEHDWDVDFYQCSFYRSWFGVNRPVMARTEDFGDDCRQAMVKTIRAVSKPVIAFKILAAGRNCRTPADVERAIRFALTGIKPTDVILLGMWQKYKDQVTENIGYARKHA